MFATERGRGRRGIVMILVLVLVAVLLIVALAVITGANNAGQSTTAVSTKYRVLNSAEGGENAALDDLATNPGERNDTHLTGSLNGVPYDGWIRINNLLGGSVVRYTDPATGKTVDVPAHTAYIYGTSSDAGGRTVYVEAFAEPAPPLRLPSGAINAVHDILDLSPMTITASNTILNPNADLNANNDILVTGTPSKVQGRTSAVGEDQLPGIDGLNSHQPPVQFPNSFQVAEAARTAKLSAQTGARLNGDQVSANGTQTYTGNVYIDGNVTVSSGDVTFAQGAFVYVNGNLCINGSGAVNNLNATSEFVVAGTVEVSGTGSYSISPGGNTLLLVMGSDNAESPCSLSNTHAVDLRLGTNTPIGTIYAPNGSIDLIGDGTIVGAVDAGLDVRLDGSTSAAMQYDAAQANTTMSTGTLSYNPYIEY